jgi:hypothetical protein
MCYINMNKGNIVAIYAFTEAFERDMGITDMHI